MGAMAPTLYLVDGTSQLFRAYFALPGLTNREGLPTHAVFGFTTMLNKLLKEEQPQYIAVAFDSPAPTFRHERFADYKAHRPEPPEDLRRQVPYAKEVCRVLNIPVLEEPGYEADDLIATYARLAREAGFEVVIVAADKDLLQLVGDRVRLLHPVKNVTLDAEGVRQSFGVPPDRVRDVLGLMGDSVDNIPGVPGVGEKTALAMVRTYGALEAILERAARLVALFDARDRLLAAVEDAEDPARAAKAGLEAAWDAFRAAARALLPCESDEEFRARLEGTLARLEELWALTRNASDKQRSAAWKSWRRELKELEKGSSRRIWSAVHEHAQQARLSRELATLDREVPATFAPQRFLRGEPQRDRARALFELLEFKRLVSDFGLGAARGRGDEEAEARAAFAVEVERLEGKEAQERFAAACRERGRLGVEVLADGPDPLRARALALGLSFGAGRGAALALERAGATPAGSEASEQARAVLRPLLAEASILKVATDQKAAQHLLERAGLRIAGWGIDPSVAAFLLDPGRGSYALEKLAWEHLGRELPALQVHAGDGEDAFDVASREHLLAERAEASLRLAEMLERRLEEQGLLELYRTIDGPLLEVLARMERWGIRLDVDKLREMSSRMEAWLARLRQDIHRLAGVEFNVDSPKQLREVLFERLGLKPIRTTAKSGVHSTDARTLEELAAEHPIARAIMEYRELAKLKGTYVDALPALVHPQTGRLHTRYNPTGAATGRLSSAEPNLQNIPVRSEVGLEIRAAFVADSGFVFLASDYSQIELRVLAHISRDPELVEAFRRGADIHRYTAARIHGIAPELVDEATRRRAKAVNFGILYGISESRLAAEQGIKRTEARRFMRAYFERFRGVRDYIASVREQARRDGAVRTLFGRVRYFPQLKQRRAGRAAHEAALRAAVNTTVQGTAADLMKLAMLRVDRALRERGLGARMLLQVHDELLFEVPEQELEPTRELVRREMEGVYPLDVPLVVDQKVGRNWKEAT